MRVNASRLPWGAAFSFARALRETGGFMGVQWKRIARGQPQAAEAAAGPSLGTVLRERRRVAGLTQQDLADLAGVSLGMIRDLEQERTRLPRGQSVAALLSALGLPADLMSQARAGGGSCRTRVPAARAAEWGELHIDLLGPLLIRRGSVDLRVASAKQRALLGRLALAANSIVPTRSLVDLLWQDTELSSPQGAVHTHIWRLRRVLEPARQHRSREGVITRCAGGYRLDLADEHLDLGAFRALMRMADALTLTTPARALDLMEDALGRWRGRPLADVEELTDHPAVTALLDEQVVAVVQHADLAATLDQDHRSLRWLQQVCAVHPLHEPLHARLVAALAAAGRQAEALLAHQRVRRRLADELGVVPGPELTEAHRGVLRRQLRDRTDQPASVRTHGSLRITTPSRSSA